MDKFGNCISLRSGGHRYARASGNRSGRERPREEQGVQRGIPDGQCRMGPRGTRRGHCGLQLRSPSEPGGHPRPVGKRSERIRCRGAGEHSLDPHLPPSSAQCSAGSLTGVTSTRSRTRQTSSESFQPVPQSEATVGTSSPRSSVPSCWCSSSSRSAAAGKVTAAWLRLERYLSPYWSSLSAPRSVVRLAMQSGPRPGAAHRARFPADQRKGFERLGVLAGSGNGFR